MTLTSRVWKYMSRIAGSPGEAVCRVCGARFKRTGGTTSSMIKHLRQQHPKEFVASGITFKGKRNLSKRTHQVGNCVVVVSNGSDSGTTEHPQLWNVMTKNADGTTVTCSLCGITFLWNAGQSTSAICKHLKVNHPTEFSTLGISEEREDSGGGLCVMKTEREEEVNPAPKLVSLLSKGSRASQIKSPLVNLLASRASHNEAPAVESQSTRKPITIHKTKKLDSLLMNMVCSELLPFSLTENQSFQQFVKVLDSQYTLPKPEAFATTYLKESYECVKQEVKFSLKEAVTVAVSVDKWTPVNADLQASGTVSSGNTFFYLTLSAHFLTPLWELKSMVLSSPCVSNEAGVEEIAHCLKTEFEQWGIDSKINSVITDQTPNLVTAVQSLNLEHGLCFGQALNFAIHTALKSSEMVTAVANRVRDIVNYFESSTELANVLYDTQNGESQERLTVHDERYWPSTLSMFRSYLKRHESVCAALQGFQSESNICITPGELNVISTTVDTLEAFELAWEEMCSETYTPLSMMIPVVRQLQDYLSEMPDQAFDLTSELQHQLILLFPFIEENFQCGASTVLDPRFKYVPFADSGKAKVIESGLTAKLSNKFMSEQTSAAAERGPEKSPPPRKRRSLWNKFDSKVNDIIEASSPATTGAAIEMRRYEESMLLRRDEIAPFKWWKENRTVMPHLSDLAREFLCIPAISIPAARLISKEGHQVLAKRSCIPINHIEEVLFLQSNHKV
ncbi:zinc finger BED domain-containing protein 4 [Aplysia californica]|uniref:Zinc finger BED domain-containing protein 4 n=1 Tax=Aplysia californica TaxID=6500 RepID=A0ABM0K0R2_APLCA|nr:zinc finger BED domain-containing protein 4 [Aplysia californica]